MRSVPAEQGRPVAVSDLQQPQQSGATGVPRRFRQLKIQIQFFGFNFSLNVSKQSHFTDWLCGRATDAAARGTWKLAKIYAASGMGTQRAALRSALRMDNGQRAKRMRMEIRMSISCCTLGLAQFFLRKKNFRICCSGSWCRCCCSCSCCCCFSVFCCRCGCCGALNAENHVA